MKKFIKNNLLSFILGAIIFGGIGVYATEGLLASRKVTYNDTRVDSALNELYQKARNINIDGHKVCKLIDETYGSFLEVGSKYECEVGNNIKENFYLLWKNGNVVNLIMEDNITETVGSKTLMDWNEAMAFFDTAEGQAIKNNWVNVINVGHPSIKDIANAVGNISWNPATATTYFCFDTNYDQLCQTDPAAVKDDPVQLATKWLYNGKNGYWTKDLVDMLPGKAWAVYKPMKRIDDNGVSRVDYGVRPVITLYLPSLYTDN